MSFIAGPYTISYNGVALGITEDGIELDEITFEEAIRGDNLGSADQDAIYRAGNRYLSFVGEEWNLLSNATIFRPWAAFGGIGQVGRLATANAKTVVLTVVPGTPAVITGLNTLSAAKAILARDFNVKHLYSTRLKKTPIRLQLYPFTSASETIHFAVT